MTELEKAVKHFKGVWPEGWVNMGEDEDDAYGFGEFVLSEIEYGV